MDKQKLIEQWNEKGWMWIPKGELEKVWTLIIPTESLPVSVQPSANGYFVRKLY